MIWLRDPSSIPTSVHLSFTHSTSPQRPSFCPSDILSFLRSQRFFICWSPWHRNTELESPVQCESSMKTSEMDSLVRQGMGLCSWELTLKLLLQHPLWNWRMLCTVTQCSAFCHFYLLFIEKLSLKLWCEITIVQRSQLTLPSPCTDGSSQDKRSASDPPASIRHLTPWKPREQLDNLPFPIGAQRCARLLFDLRSQL